jgi:GT2 family glycosyltransferase
LVSVLVRKRGRHFKIKAGAISVSGFGRINALVLTYNRKEILARCLRAVLAQLEAPHEIVVLDNGSTDGTVEHLRASGLLDHIILYRLPQNAGPAAGIDVLFRISMERGADWMWFLDDDTIANADALSELKVAYSQNFAAPEELGFLRSFVVFPDGGPYDLPPVDLRHARGQSPSWADRLGAGLVRVRWCQLNSIFVPRSTILRVGNISPFFYFSGEDTDFTLRVTDVLPGYIVGKSRATHLVAITGAYSSRSEADPGRIGLGKYHYRNQVYLRLRCYSFWRMVLYVGKCVLEALLALGARTYPLRRSATILHGVFSGLLFIAMPRMRDQRLRKALVPLQVSGPRRPEDGFERGSNCSFEPVDTLQLPRHA